MEIKQPISPNLPKHGRGLAAFPRPFINKEKSRLTFKRIDKNGHGLLDYDFHVEFIRANISAWNSHAGWGSNKDTTQSEDSNAHVVCPVALSSPGQLLACGFLGKAPP